MQNNWKTVSLGDIATLITSGSRGWAGYYADEGSKFIRMTNLPRVGISLKLNDLKYVKLPANNSEGSRTLLTEGDVLISITAELGKIGYVTESLGEAYINQHLALVRFDRNKVEPKFVAYALSTTTSRNAFNRRNDSGAKAGLNLPTIKKFHIKIPDIAEQRRIIAILETWDEYIKKIASTIDVKERLKDDLIQELLSGKRRLDGYSRDWKDVSLDELVKNNQITMGRGDVISKKDIEAYPGDYPIYSSSVKNDGLFGQYGKYMFDEELVSWSVDGGGHFFYRPKSRFSVTNVSGWIRVNDEQLSCHFLALQLQMLHRRKTFDYQFKAHPSVIRSIYNLSLPTIEEQRAIVEIIDTSVTEIKLLHKKKLAMQEQYKYLVTAIFSGHLNVPSDSFTSREELQHA